MKTPFGNLVSCDNKNENERMLDMYSLVCAVISSQYLSRSTILLFTQDSAEPARSSRFNPFRGARRLTQRVRNVRARVENFHRSHIRALRADYAVANARLLIPVVRVSFCGRETLL